MAFSRQADVGTWRAGTVLTGCSHTRPGKGGPVGSRKQTRQRSLPCLGVATCRRLSGAWPMWPGPCSLELPWVVAKRGAGSRSVHSSWTWRQVVCVRDGPCVTLSPFLAGTAESKQAVRVQQALVPPTWGCAAEGVCLVLSPGGSSAGLVQCSPAHIFMSFVVYFRPDESAFICIFSMYHIVL